MQCSIQSYKDIAFYLRGLQLLRELAKDAKKNLGASRRQTLIGAAGDPSSDHRCYTLELTMEQAKCRK